MKPIKAAIIENWAGYAEYIDPEASEEVTRFARKVDRW